MIKTVVDILNVTITDMIVILGVPRTISGDQIIEHLCVVLYISRKRYLEIATEQIRFCVSMLVYISWMTLHLCILQISKALQCIY